MSKASGKSKPKEVTDGKLADANCCLTLTKLVTGDRFVGDVDGLCSGVVARLFGILLHCPFKPLDDIVTGLSANLTVLLLFEERVSEARSVIELELECDIFVRDSKGGSRVIEEVIVSIEGRFKEELGVESEEF